MKTRTTKKPYPRGLANPHPDNCGSLGIWTGRKSRTEAAGAPPPAHPGRLRPRRPWWPAGARGSAPRVTPRSRGRPIPAAAPSETPTPPGALPLSRRPRRLPAPGPTRRPPRRDLRSPEDRARRATGGRGGPRAIRAPSRSPRPTRTHSTHPAPAQHEEGPEQQGVGAARCWRRSPRMRDAWSLTCRSAAPSFDRRPATTTASSPSVKNKKIGAVRLPGGSLAVGEATVSPAAAIEAESSETHFVVRQCIVAASPAHLSRSPEETSPSEHPPPCALLLEARAMWAELDAIHRKRRVRRDGIDGTQSRAGPAPHKHNHAERLSSHTVHTSAASKRTPPESTPVLQGSRECTLCSDATPLRYVAKARRRASCTNRGTLAMVGTSNPP